MLWRKLLLLQRLIRRIGFRERALSSQSHVADAVRRCRRRMEMMVEEVVVESPMEDVVNFHSTLQFTSQSVYRPFTPSTRCLIITFRINGL
jgi:hypothetical protein